MPNSTTPRRRSARLRVKAELAAALSGVKIEDSESVINVKDEIIDKANEVQQEEAAKVLEPTNEVQEVQEEAAKVPEPTVKYTIARTGGGRTKRPKVVRNTVKKERPRPHPYHAARMRATPRAPTPEPELPAEQKKEEAEFKANLMQLYPNKQLLVENWLLQVSSPTSTDGGKLADSFPESPTVTDYTPSPVPTLSSPITSPMINTPGGGDGAGDAKTPVRGGRGKKVYRKAKHPRAL